MENKVLIVKRRGHAACTMRIKDPEKQRLYKMLAANNSAFRSVHYTVTEARP